jgi:molybdenum cofactor synthesis domain-containing protein
MTGAPLPEGCDAVVMVEDTEHVGSDSVRIHKSVPAGSAFRLAGSDVAVGDTVIAAGTQVTPMVEGVLASVNAKTVSVYPRISVGVISTGDELVDDGSALQIGQIRESNRLMLLRLVAEAGATPVDLGIIRDDEPALEHALRTAVNERSCDVIITSGGVSMGDYDVVKAVLSRIANMQWFQIAMKPAKPFAFGTLANDRGVNVPIFGLPGNPVSSLMSFELIARPALRNMMVLVPHRIALKCWPLQMKTLCATKTERFTSTECVLSGVPMVEYMCVVPEHRGVISWPQPLLQMHSSLFPMAMDFELVTR